MCEQILLSAFFFPCLENKPSCVKCTSSLNPSAVEQKIASQDVSKMFISYEYIQLVLLYVFSPVGQKVEYSLQLCAVSFG